ncbi:MAG: PKD domain-containing protein [Proteobacteria bacterium]|nr:PKD domain-containing protein [Pseudomonadota bacterium]
MKKTPIIGILSLLFHLILLAEGFAATKIYLPNAMQIQAQAKQVQTLSIQSLESTLGLTPQEGLQLLGQRTDESGITHSRYRQLFNGIPIWGHHIIVVRNVADQVISIHGTKVAEIAADLTSPSLAPSTLTSQAALEQMKQRHIANSSSPGLSWIFKNEVNKTVISLDGDNLARICYLISFVADTEMGGHPSRPVILLNAATGEIISEFDGLTHANGTGPGGNEKIGLYHYGQEFPPLEVFAVGGQCTMNIAKVKTVNLNHNSSGSTAYTYACYENTFKTINGAYSPINDAHFMATTVHDMYKNWFKITPLNFQIVIGVHYSNNYDNAFWDGSSVSIGDGWYNYYPLVGLNVISHEISHGFTEQHSDLIYSGESGGINEAFSDIAGEAAEFYLKGTNDFLVANDIRKGPGALRYMDNPPEDGKSIDSANAYVNEMNVHYSSGVFNKAFYLLATTPGWDTRKAFAVFVKANQDYWEPSTNFFQGAEGVRDAAISLGYSSKDVQNAFAAVDIYIDVPQGLNAVFSTYTDQLTVNFTDASTCSNCTIVDWQWDFGDGQTSADQNPSHTYGTEGSYTATLTVTDSVGGTASVSNIVQAGMVLDYCETGGYKQSYEWIKTLTVENFTHSSGPSGYSDFASEVIELQKDTTTEVNLTPGFSSAAFKEYWRIWADLNRDGDFEDVGEKLFEGNGTGAVKGTITIPIAAIDGATRLRTGMKYGGYPEPCGNFNYGEVEDYTLFIGTGNPTPQAAFSYSVSGLTVSFTDSSINPAGNIESWHWDFGDGDQSSEQHPQHTYASPGTYQVTLTITDSSGLTGSEDQSLTLSGPSANFHSAAAKLTVTFTDQSTAPTSTIVDWHWDFGDGGQSFEQHPVYPYAATGTFTVTLTVTDKYGLTDSVAKLVTVSDKATYCSSMGNSQSFEWITQVTVGAYAKNSGAAGYSDFTNQIFTVQKEIPTTLSLTQGFTGTPYKEFWRVWADLNQDGDFDDADELLFHGTGGTVVNSTITLPPTVAVGTTRLRVSMRYGLYPSSCGTFSYGEVEDYTLQISSSNIGPQTAFSHTVEGLTASFTDMSSGDIVERHWDFGDVSQSSDQHPIHTYVIAGTYAVTLTVTDGNGLTGSATQLVTVGEGGLNYCETKGNTQTYEWIAQVEAGLQTKTSGPGGYSNFTELIINIQKGASMTIKMTPGFANSPFSEYWRLWADLNHDGDFNDSGELLFEGTGKASVIGMITIPADAITGATRLRTAMRYNNYPPACGTFNYGEVEDYTLNIQ